MSEACDGVDILGCLDGTAGKEDRDHVAGCDACRRERRSLAKQVQLLTVHFRGRGPCPAPKHLVESAETGEDVEPRFARHLEACADCAAEWQQIREALATTRELDSRPIALPEELSRAIADRLPAARILDGSHRFSRRASDDALPAAAQPEDLTDAGDDDPARDEDDAGDED